MLPRSIILLTFPHRSSSSIKVFCLRCQSCPLLSFLPSHPVVSVHYTYFTLLTTLLYRWLGSRVVSVLDSGEKARVQIAAATLSGNSLRQTIHACRASVHQAAKLVAVFLRVAGATVGLTESNGRLPPGL